MVRDSVARRHRSPIALFLTRQPPALGSKPDGGEKPKDAEPEDMGALYLPIATVLLVYCDCVEES
jgi:hypothetical protein